MLESMDYSMERPVSSLVRGQREARALRGTRCTHKPRPSVSARVFDRSLQRDKRSAGTQMRKAVESIAALFLSDRK